MPSWNRKMRNLLGQNHGVTVVLLLLLPALVREGKNCRRRVACLQRPWIPLGSV